VGEVGVHLEQVALGLHLGDDLARRVDRNGVFASSKLENNVVAAGILGILLTIGARQVELEVELRGEPLFFKAALQKVVQALASVSFDVQVEEDSKNGIADCTLKNILLGVGTHNLKRKNVHLFLKITASNFFPVFSTL
jgi:hypothetical protein